MNYKEIKNELQITDEFDRGQEIISRMISLIPDSSEQQYVLRGAKCVKMAERLNGSIVSVSDDRFWEYAADNNIVVVFVSGNDLHLKGAVTGIYNYMSLILPGTVDIKELDGFKLNIKCSQERNRTWEFLTDIPSYKFQMLMNNKLCDGILFSTDDLRM